MFRHLFLGRRQFVDHYYLEKIFARLQVFT